MINNKLNTQPIIIYHFELIFLYNKIMEFIILFLHLLKIQSAQTTNHQIKTKPFSEGTPTIDYWLKRIRKQS